MHKIMIAIQTLLFVPISLIAGEIKHVASDRTDDVFFGDSVSVEGDVMAVGATGWDEPGVTNAGAVYVFHKINGMWVEIQKLVANDLDPTYQHWRFGRSVDLVLAPDGDFLAVGADSAESVHPDLPFNQMGAVYLYKRDPNAVEPWVFFQKIIPLAVVNGGAALSRFGFDVSIDYTVPVTTVTGLPVYTLAVGAPGYWLSNGPQDGAVFVYQLQPFDSFTFAGANPCGTISDPCGGLLYNTPRADGKFGTSVDLEGDQLIVGVPEDENTGFKGSAYVFGRANELPSGLYYWTASALQPVLTASDGELGDRFGESVAIDQVGPSGAANFIVGAPNDDDAAQEAGAIYIYENFAVEDLKIPAPPGTAGLSLFGSSVDVLGGVIVVGEKPNGAVGRTHVYLPVSTLFWIPWATFAASDGAVNDEYGKQVVYADRSVFSGAHRVDINQGAVYEESGAVHIFTDGFESGNTSAWSATIP